jgi:hypothetical protein
VAINITIKQYREVSMNKFLLSLALLGLTLNAEAIKDYPASSSSSSEANRDFLPQYIPYRLGGKPVSWEEIWSAPAPTPEQISSANFSNPVCELFEVVLVRRSDGSISWGVVISIGQGDPTLGEVPGVIYAVQVDNAMYPSIKSITTANPGLIGKQPK